MPRKQLTERQRRFVEVYSRTASLSRAVRDAGYSEGVDPHTFGGKMLQTRAIRDAIAAKGVNRTAHAEQTYRDMISVANASLQVLKDTMENPTSELADKEMAIEGAGRQLERLAKAEGLYIHPADRQEGHSGVSLQTIIQLIGTQLGGVSPQRIMDATVRVIDDDNKPPQNGNGNGQDH
jgi:phage terminase small subunit